MPATYSSSYSRHIFSQLLCPAPWDPPTHHIILQKLSGPKSSVPQHVLHMEATCLQRDAHTDGALRFFTDGSVDPDTGTVGAIFVANDTTAPFWLADGCFILQAELVAIIQALRYVCPCLPPQNYCPALTPGLHCKPLRTPTPVTMST